MDSEESPSSLRASIPWLSNHWEAVRNSKPSTKAWGRQIIASSNPQYIYDLLCRITRGTRLDVFGRRTNFNATIHEDIRHQMATKKMTDPKTGVTVEVNNIPYGVYRQARTEEEREDWFWEDVFVEATNREGEVIDVNELDVSSALSIVELAMTGILGKKVSSRRG